MSNPILPATCKHHVLFAHHDLFRGITDTMQGCGTGRCDGIVDALNLYAVDRFAEMVEDMHFGTASGPIRLGDPAFNTT